MTARSPTSTLVQYEDFLPKFEWKEETGSHILALYLPSEFKKEQIRITYVQSTRMIRVNGERPIVNKKWSRFNQGFPVPQNCDVNKIEATYKNGVLTLTMPNAKPATTPQLPIVTIDETKSPQKITPPPPPGPPPPSTTAVKQADAVSAANTQKTSPEPKPQKRVESSSTPDPTPKKGQNGTTEKTAPPKDSTKQKDDTSFPQEDESRKIIKEKVVGESSGDKESSKKRKESLSDVKSDGLKKENGEDKANAGFIGEKAKLVKGVADAAKRNLQELSMEVNEDRQAMVNVGVAFLVIVALGTYIYYSRGSSRRAK